MAVFLQVTSLDVLATVLEEMPPYPEKESSGLLNLLKKKRPGRVPENPEIKLGGSGGGDSQETNGESKSKAAGKAEETSLLKR